MKKAIIYWSKVAIIGIFVGFSIQFAVAAWTEPPSSPPADNVGAPINTGNNTQTKEGNLVINNSDAYATGLYVKNNIQSTGTICDGSGNCIGGSSLWTQNGTSIYYNGGNVGIGKTSPVNKLHVGGNIGATGWIGAGCEGACNSSGGYSLMYADGHIMNTSYTRSDGGFQVDGKWAVASNNVWHRAQYADNTHYGYFEALRSDGTRGAYFGYGNGTDTVNLYLQNASYLYISGGYLRLASVANCSGKLYTDSAGTIKCGTDQTGAGSSIGTTSGCHDVAVPDNSLRVCNSGEAMTGALSYGQNQMVIRCCRLTE